MTMFERFYMRQWIRVDKCTILLSSLCLRVDMNMVSHWFDYIPFTFPDIKPYIKGISNVFPERIDPYFLRIKVDVSPVFLVSHKHLIAIYYREIPWVRNVKSSLTIVTTKVETSEIQVR